MEGGSWTSNISWVRGYEQVLAPMDRASSLFHERVLAKMSPPTTPLPQRPVPPAGRRGKRLPLLGGRGTWAGYGAELARRAIDIVTYDL